MDIQKKINGEEMVICLSGRLDANTSTQLNEWFESQQEQGTSYNMDLSELEYISSAGLRELLNIHKYCMSNKKDMVITNSNSVIMDIFKMTGFLNMLNVK